MVGWRHPTRLDAPAPEAEQGRDQGDRGHHGDQHHPDPAPGQRAQERLGEGEQPAKGGGHGQPGEGHRPAGRGQGALDRRRQVEAGGPLLAEAADHQQRVVDGQPEAEHGDDVDRVGGDVGDLAHPEQDEQGPGHGHDRHQQGRDGGHDPPEHQEQQHQHHRQGQRLAPLQVLLGPLLELLLGPLLAADQDPGGVDGLQPLADPFHRPLVVAAPQPGLELDPDQHRPAVRGHQPGDLPAVHPGAGDPADTRGRLQVVDGGGDLGLEGRVGGRPAADQPGDLRPAARDPAEQVGHDHRLGVVAQAAAGAEPAEHLAADPDPDPEDQHPGQRHGHPAPVHEATQGSEHGPSIRRPGRLRGPKLAGRTGRGSVGSRPWACSGAGPWGRPAPEQWRAGISPGRAGWRCRRPGWTGGTSRCG